MAMSCKNGLWTGTNSKGETFSGTFMQVIFWLKGFGKDQAAMLKFQMAERKKRTVRADGKE